MLGYNHILWYNFVKRIYHILSVDSEKRTDSRQAIQCVSLNEVMGIKRPLRVLYFCTAIVTQNLLMVNCTKVTFDYIFAVGGNALRAGCQCYRIDTPVFYFPVEA